MRASQSVSSRRDIIPPEKMGSSEGHTDRTSGGVWLEQDDLCPAPPPHQTGNGARIDFSIEERGGTQPQCEVLAD